MNLKLGQWMLTKVRCLSSFHLNFRKISGKMDECDLVSIPFATCTVEALGFSVFEIQFLKITRGFMHNWGICEEI